MRKKIIIAHRGASAYAKENTIESFEKAIEMGADMIEFDVRKTKDNIFIACHDELIDNKAINELTYEEIKRIFNNIITIEEILKLVKGRIKLDIELKEKGYEKEVIELVLKYFKKHEFIITSFNDSSLKTIKNTYSNLKTGLILGKETPKNLIRTRISELFPIKRALQTKVDFIAPHWKLLKFGLLKRARNHNMPVFVWTINSKKKIKKFFSNNLIKAVITDKPDIFLP